MTCAGPVPRELRPPKSSGAVTKDRRPTLETVAAAAGVSLATVSKVLNDRADVSAATRARVQRLLVQYKYVPPGRPMVRRFAGGRRLIDLVFTALDSPYSVEILRGVTRAPWMSWCVDAGPDRLASVVQWTRLGRTVRGHHRRFRTDPVGSTHPRPRSRSVRADRSGRQVARADVATVAMGRRALGGAASLELGHRRIAVIGGPVTMLCSRARIDGYRAALESAGVEVDPP